MKYLIGSNLNQITICLTQIDFLYIKYQLVLKMDNATDPAEIPELIRNIYHSMSDYMGVYMFLDTEEVEKLKNKSKSKLQKFIEKNCHFVPKNSDYTPIKHKYYVIEHAIMNMQRVVAYQIQHNIAEEEIKALPEEIRDSLFNPPGLNIITTFRPDDNASDDFNELIKSQSPTWRSGDAFETKILDIMGKIAKSRNMELRRKHHG